MCEYCGCQEIAVIDELTREHDAVVSRDLRRAPGPLGRGVGAGRRRGLPSGVGTPGAAHGGRGGGALPLPGRGVPRPRRCAARGTPLLSTPLLAEAASGTPEDPTWPNRLLRTLHAPARAHPQGAGRGLPRPRSAALGSEEWSGSRVSVPVLGTAPAHHPAPPTARHEPTPSRRNPSVHEPPDPRPRPPRAGRTR